MKSFPFLVCVFLSLAFFCSSCATIFNGTKQNILLDSKPQGAQVHVGGKAVGVTPVTVRQSPRKPMDVVFSYPGYEDRAYTVKNKFEWRWFLLDAPVTYAAVCIPFAVDLMTMAPYRFTEKTVVMDFNAPYVSPQKIGKADSVIQQQAAKADTVVQAKKAEVTREGGDTSVSRLEPMAKNNPLEQERIKTEAEKDEELRVARERERRLKQLERQDAIRRERILDSTLSARRKVWRDSLREDYSSLLNQFKNSITWQCTALAVRELNLTYHRNIYKGISLGVEVGHKLQSASNRVYYNNDVLNNNSPTTEIMLMPFSESLYLAGAVKFPIPKIVRGMTYVSVVGFSRNTSYDHATITWEDQVDKYVVKRFYDSVKVEQSAYGTKILFGLRPIIKLSEHAAFEFDLYAGIGLRILESNIYHYQESSQYTSPISTSKVIDRTDRVERFSGRIPSVHLGFRMGLRF